MTETNRTPIVSFMAALAFDTLRATIKADLQEFRATTKADLQDLELRVMDKFESLYKHLWAMSVGIVTAVVALMKLLS